MIPCWFCRKCTLAQWMWRRLHCDWIKPCWLSFWDNCGKTNQAPYAAASPFEQTQHFLVPHKCSCQWDACSFARLLHPKDQQHVVGCQFKLWEGFQVHYNLGNSVKFDTSPVHDCCLSLRKKWREVKESTGKWWRVTVVSAHLACRDHHLLALTGTLHHSPSLSFTLSDYPAITLSLKQ